MRALFITGTGTDIGKTYVSAAYAKYMHDHKFNIAYYKAAASGSKDISSSDGGYVKEVAKLNQEESSLLSYLYQDPLSPHLAARKEKNFASLEKIKKDFNALKNYDYVLCEGAGGIICPLVYEDGKKILYEDVIKALNLSVVVVSDAGLGTINHTVLTLNYLKDLNIKVKGVILNRYDKENPMHKDNKFMIEQLGHVKVIALLGQNEEEFTLLDKPLETYFDLGE